MLLVFLQHLFKEVFFEITGARPKTDLLVSPRSSVLRLFGLVIFTYRYRFSCDGLQTDKLTTNNVFIQNRPSEA